MSRKFSFILYEYLFREYVAEYVKAVDPAMAEQIPAVMKPIIAFQYREMEYSISITLCEAISDWANIRISVQNGLVKDRIWQNYDKTLIQNEQSLTKNYALNFNGCYEPEYLFDMEKLKQFEDHCPMSERMTTPHGIFEDQLWNFHPFNDQKMLTNYPIKAVPKAAYNGRARGPTVSEFYRSRHGIVLRYPSAPFIRVVSPDRVSAPRRLATHPLPRPRPSHFRLFDRFPHSAMPGHLFVNLSTDDVPIGEPGIERRLSRGQTLAIHGPITLHVYPALLLVCILLFLATFVTSTNQLPHDICEQQFGSPPAIHIDSIFLIHPPPFYTIQCPPKLHLSPPFAQTPLPPILPSLKTPCLANDMSDLLSQKRAALKRAQEELAKAERTKRRPTPAPAGRPLPLAAICPSPPKKPALANRNATVAAPDDFRAILHRQFARLTTDQEAAAQWTERLKREIAEEAEKVIKGLKEVIVYSIDIQRQLLNEQAVAFRSMRRSMEKAPDTEDEVLSVKSASSSAGPPANNPSLAQQFATIERPNFQLGTKKNATIIDVLVESLPNLGILF
ncbi:hypothetical protein niasHT_012366 [Heterodera trifolii]|uniref:Uncharacterized protein n=1 Tax=Heterodera trifolii TaxID=157864 RepID=A0ABD2L2Q7_9BILA